jgi:F-type H+-transporting ATPase subunit delta
MKISKDARRVSRQLFRVCMDNGKLDESRVRLVVRQVSASKPRGYLGILHNFHRLLSSELARSQASIVSAVELDGIAKAELHRGLTAKYGRQMTLQYSVNPALLGGIRVQVGSDVWDGSVKSRLEALQASLS